MSSCNRCRGTCHCRPLGCNPTCAGKLTKSCIPICVEERECIEVCQSHIPAAIVWNDSNTIQDVPPAGTDISRIIFNKSDFSNSHVIFTADTTTQQRIIINRPGEYEITVNGGGYLNPLTVPIGTDPTLINGALIVALIVEHFDATTNTYAIDQQFKFGSFHEIPTISSGGGTAVFPAGRFDGTALLRVSQTPVFLSLGNLSQYIISPTQLVPVPTFLILDGANANLITASMEVKRIDNLQNYKIAEPDF